MRRAARSCSPDRAPGREDREWLDNKLRPSDATLWSMAANRRQILETMLAQNSSDCFARYGLAMELASGGDLEGAAQHFRTLIEINPKYVAAYFHGGQTCEKLGDIEGARALYQRGIEEALAAGDLHTRSELQAALDLL